MLACSGIGIAQAGVDVLVAEFFGFLCHGFRLFLIDYAGLSGDVFSAGYGEEYAKCGIAVRVAHFAALPDPHFRSKINQYHELSQDTTFSSIGDTIADNFNVELPEYGKSYLKEIGYSDIQLYHNITDTVNKSLDERKKLFTSSIYFRDANEKKKLREDEKKKRSELLDKLLLKFEDEKFYYTMSVLYYIARK